MDSSDSLLESSTTSSEVGDENGSYGVTLQEISSIRGYLDDIRAKSQINFSSTGGVS